MPSLTPTPARASAVAGGAASPGQISPDPPSTAALRLLAAGQRAAGRGDPLAALVAYAAARRRCEPAAAPALAAELARRLDRTALRLRPPAAVAAAAHAPGAPVVRAWLRRALALPPPLVLLVLARARWFMPAEPAADRRRAPLARALLAGLEAGRPPLDGPLRAFVLAGPLVDRAGSVLMARGLAAYAAGDDLAALHLLVPSVEALLRDLACAAEGADPAAARAAAGRGLDGLLRHPPLRRALGEGLAVQLRAVLLDGGLRHRLAHGRLPPAACTRAVASDVVLCCLRLSHRPAQPAPAGANAGRGGVEAARSTDLSA